MKCKNAYEQISDKTKKIMVFCKSKGDTPTFGNLCISQRFCAKEDRYIESNQENYCKLYEQNE